MSAATGSVNGSLHEGESIASGYEVLGHLAELRDAGLWKPQPLLAPAAARWTSTTPGASIGTAAASPRSFGPTGRGRGCAGG